MSISVVETADQPTKEPDLLCVEGYEEAGEIYCACPICNRIEDSLVTVRIKQTKLVMETWGVFTDLIKVLPKEAPAVLVFCIGCESQYLADFRAQVW